MVLIYRQLGEEFNAAWIEAKVGRRSSGLCPDADNGRIGFGPLDLPAAVAVRDRADRVRPQSMAHGPLAVGGAIFQDAVAPSQPALPGT